MQTIVQGAFSPPPVPHGSWSGDLSRRYYAIGH
jgi:hypothetical protein